MSSKYYDSSGKEVYDGDIAEASDLNTINTAVDTAFQVVEQDIIDNATDAEYWADRAEKWAEEAEDVEVDTGKYSSKHYSLKSADSASAASTSAGEASASASAASNSEANAATSESNAADSYTDTYNLWLDFDSKYLGSFAVAPTLNNQGGALVGGELYFDSVIGRLQLYNGSEWILATYEDGLDITASSLQLTGGTGTQGLLSWNTDEETVDLILDGSTLQLGQEVLAHVRNNTASEIVNGTPVMITGTLGASGRITIAPMDGTDPSNNYLYLGVTTEDIAAGEDGKVLHYGKLRDVDTSGWTEGDILWTSGDTVGELTNVQPTSGVAIPTAIVITSHATNGVLGVRVSIHDYNAMVVKTSPTGSVDMPVGTTAQRDSVPEAGYLRFNSDDNSFEGYDGSEWGAIGGGGGIVVPESVQTTDFTAEIGKSYPVDVSGGDIVVTPPSNPSAGDWFILFDYDGSCGIATSIFVDGVVHGDSEGVRISASNVALLFQYIDATVGWKIVDGIGEQGSEDDAGITTIWEGSAGNGETVDWSSTGYSLSQFDAIIFKGVVSGHDGTSIGIPADLLAGNSSWVINYYDTEKRYTIVQNVTETSLTILTAGGGTLTGIYGIKYK